MRIIETQVYKFSELDERAQDKAINHLGDLNVDYAWYEYTYEDAANVGIEITSFDTYRHQIDGKLKWTVQQVVEAILKEYGSTCQTYITASACKTELDRVQTAQRLADDNEDEDAFQACEDELEQIESDFVKSILDDYLIMLREEHEYQRSREAIVESIEANEYEFTKEGQLI